MRNFVATVVANGASATSVAASQTPSGAGAVTLTATPVTFGSNAAQQVTIISTGNISNRTFVVSGTDVQGNVISETITGPNNATVTTVNYFASVTGVTISGAAAAAITMGNAATAVSPMYVVDGESNPVSIGFGTILVTGTPTWTVQHTFDDVLSTGLPNKSGPGTTAYSPGATTNTWFNHPFVVGATANSDGNYAFPVAAVRLQLSAAGTARIQLFQSGAGTR